MNGKLTGYKDKPITDLRDCIYLYNDTIPSLVRVYDAATGAFHHFEKPNGEPLSPREARAEYQRNGGKPQPVHWRATA